MKTFSFEVGSEQPNGGRIRRSSYFKDGLIRSPGNNIYTLFDLFENSATLYPDVKGFGYRKVKDIITEEKEITKIVNGEEVKQKKTWSYYELSGYHYMTYKEGFDFAQQVGAGLAHIGLKSKSKIEVFSPTNVYWILTAHSAFTQNMTIVTAYDTLGEEGLLHSMNETEVEAIYTVGDLLPTVAKVAKNCPSLKYIIYSGDAKPEVLEKMDVTQSIYTLAEVAKMGREHPIDNTVPSPEDTCCIMYTSGSTGNPKGVILAHQNIVSAVAGVNVVLGSDISHKDSIVSYLPLAHVLEFTVENACMFWGVTIGYGSVKTLTDASVRNCKGDIKEFRPTLLAGVPAVWESIRKGVLTKVNETSVIQQSIFHGAVYLKSLLSNYSLPTSFIDSIVFKKVQEQVGGRLRIAVSGGAPLSAETQSFLSSVLTPILVGFGMTESCSMCTLMNPAQFQIGVIGAPVPCVEIKLVDVPEANYYSHNKPKPQGEIWVRGPAVTQGYWKRDDVTKETITEDNWLKTGDIGEWNDDGTLNVIDRKKNLVKLSNGEYIALEKLESVYKSCIHITNICVCANPLYPKPVALVMPSEPAIMKLANDNNIKNKGFEDLCADPKMKKLVLNSLLEQGKKAGLKGTELLCDVYICPEEWTVEQGLLTAAQKLKRFDINKTYKAEIDAMNSKQQQ